ncbi:hypothetical protein B0H13DRAFT_2031658 [Mycena leptocephala]|nr:hypothetical protein B0H13DRAFT_2031658 [Mycena leptocephala]
MTNRPQISAGLAASIALLLLSFSHSHFHREAKNDGLQTLLEQVEHPTDDNLRDAGMVRTKLVTRRHLRKQRSCEMF